MMTPKASAPNVCITEEIADFEEIACSEITREDIHTPQVPTVPTKEKNKTGRSSG